MSAYFAALAALLLGAPLATLAQAADPVPAHRFYGGLAIYDGSNQSVRGFYRGERLNIPVQATLGYQLRPRLALQVGLAYSGGKSDYADTYNYVDSNLIPITYSTSSTSLRRATSASLLARYTLTRRASHRFQVDAVGGLSFDHSFYRITGTDTYASQGTIEVRPYEYSGAYNSLLVSLGPGFRYRFGPRLEAVCDILFYTPLTGSYHALNTSLALGLRYRFGPS
ncbi:outer membrane beta-barrel protein [Hymenobacter cheonanensis]|uniref:outer membrane beta-barrel protein n=1 Tax=Hymenobacter sp. CA2-7 TaxID=3063993 RepID=UPI0027132A05|nr:outer membrane beta-barrel protein [Hymenobacter sp. CA2-7]MDO7884034.1 outer membrane beta-barrel protein [Hymenobacter sp. CA2-7]